MCRDCLLWAHDHSSIAQSICSSSQIIITNRGISSQSRASIPEMEGSDDLWQLSLEWRGGQNGTADVFFPHFLTEQLKKPNQPKFSLKRADHRQNTIIWLVFFLCSGQLPDWVFWTFQANLSTPPDQVNLSSELPHDCCAKFHSYNVQALRSSGRIGPFHPPKQK